ncbi:hypothetical protein [Amaricoccus solimangrovi]|uniref:Acyl-CoA transferase n=1 Tax=Amaricoccus solimangrovi TaxID=2589815 RepID=A0A501WCW0_9RHOB|nr:hypothetical protein [Amaricoccus solimangrovi]TPE47228.1 hypothetical protein FJM51_20450 [Amaricoccus solimangrovi]
MATVHETIAARIHAALLLCFAEEGDPPVSRAAVLPEDCPSEGLVNLRLEDPVEEGRVFGVPAREWSRVAAVEIVAQPGDEAGARALFDALAAKVGGLRGQAIEGVDYLDLSAPGDVEDPPILGDAPVRAGIVQITLYYETGDNPLEEI